MAVSPRRRLLESVPRKTAANSKKTLRAGAFKKRHRELSVARDNPVPTPEKSTDFSGKGGAAERCERGLLKKGAAS